MKEYKLDSVEPLVLKPANFMPKSNPSLFGDKWSPGWCP